MKNASGQFLCTHCNYTTKNQSTMHYHLAGHEGALPHKCKHCESAFPQKGVLDLHIKLKHPETLQKKETFKCPCNECSYEDVRKGNRLIHFLRVHFKDLTEKLKVPLKDKEEGICACNNCNKTFKSNTLFYYHAHKCVAPTENHPHFSQWLEVK